MTKSSRKESSFAAEMPRYRYSSKISALVPQEHQIRMRSDERENAFLGQICCTYLSTLRTL